MSVLTMFDVLCEPPDNGPCDKCGIYVHNRQRWFGFCLRCMFDMKMRVAGVRAECKLG